MKSTACHSIAALEQRQLLSGEANISISNDVGVHMAAIHLPTGSQGFVDFLSAPDSGEAFLDPDNPGQVIYGSAGVEGFESFQFAYLDAAGQTQPFTVNVATIGVAATWNSPPTPPVAGGPVGGPGGGPLGLPPNAVDDIGTFSMYHDTAGTFTGALTNDFMGIGNGMTTCSITQQGQHGTALMDSLTGAISFVAAAGYVGSDSFRYSLSNAYGSDDALVTVTVTNSAPAANQDSLSLTITETPAEQPVYVLVNDFDNEHDEMHIATVVQPLNGGSVRIDASRLFVWYTPPTFSTTGPEVGGDVLDALDEAPVDGPVQYVTPGHDESFYDEFQYTVEDPLGARSALALVKVYTEADCRWVQKLIPIFDSPAEVGVDGSPGYSMEIAQTFGTNGQGVKLRDDAQMWQLNKVTSILRIFIRADGTIGIDPPTGVPGAFAIKDVADWENKRTQVGQNDILSFHNAKEASGEQSILMIESVDRNIGLNQPGIKLVVGANKQVMGAELQTLENSMSANFSTSSVSYLYVNKAVIDQLHADGKITNDFFEAIKGGLLGINVYYPDLPAQYESLTVGGLSPGGGFINGGKTFKYASDPGASGIY